MYPREREHQWRNAFTCTISTLPFNRFYHQHSNLLVICYSFLKSADILWNTKQSCCVETINHSVLRSLQLISSLMTPLRIKHSRKRTIIYMDIGKKWLEQRSAAFFKVCLIFLQAHLFIKLTVIALFSRSIDLRSLMSTDRFPRV